MIDDPAAAYSAGATLASFEVQLGRLAYDETCELLRDARDREREREVAKMQESMRRASWAAAWAAGASVVIAVASIVVPLVAKR